MNRAVRGALVGLMFIVSVVIPRPAQAVPFDTYITYWNGCGSEAEVVGWWYKDCNLDVYQNGQQSGHWKRVDWMQCVTWDSGVDYYEWCAGYGWTWRTEAEFQAGCQCS